MAPSVTVARGGTWQKSIAPWVASLRKNNEVLVAPQSIPMEVSSYQKNKNRSFIVYVLLSPCAFFLGVPAVVRSTMLNCIHQFSSKARFTRGLSASPTPNELSSFLYRFQGLGTHYSKDKMDESLIHSSLFQECLLDVRTTGQSLLQPGTLSSAMYDHGPGWQCLLFYDFSEYSCTSSSFKEEPFSI